MYTSESEFHEYEERDTEVALICPKRPKRKRRKPRDPRGEARRGETRLPPPPLDPGVSVTLERLGPQCRAQQPLGACPGRRERREEERWEGSMMVVWEAPVM